ncbi:hypothetical protein PR048_022280 [Dryococelus australis]|uniref:Uncharacterized protein n=1 Tax=Dryococelus australis TaxID=614101 RepID=A0ABQ9H0Q1_9NEOP|nr:hypothetical protein PR048_022280 [Dryococelus australis]
MSLPHRKLFELPPVCRARCRVRSPITRASKVRKPPKPLNNNNNNNNNNDVDRHVDKVMRQRIEGRKRRGVFFVVDVPIRRLREAIGTGHTSDWLLYATNDSLSAVLLVGEYVNRRWLANGVVACCCRATPTGQEETSSVLWISVGSGWSNGTDMYNGNPDLLKHGPSFRLGHLHLTAVSSSCTGNSGAIPVSQARDATRDNPVYFKGIIDCKSFYTIKDTWLGQYQLGYPLVDDRPITNAVKYRVVSCVVWANRTMVRSNTDTNKTCVLTVVDIAWCANRSQISLRVVRWCSGQTARSPRRRTEFDFPRGHSQWESYLTIPLVGGFSRGSPVSPAFAFRRILTSLRPQRLSIPRCYKSLHSTKKNVGMPSANQTAAQPIGNLSQHSVANRTQDPFPEPRTANQRMVRPQQSNRHAVSVSLESSLCEWLCLPAAAVASREDILPPYPPLHPFSLQTPSSRDVYVIGEEEWRREKNKSARRHVLVAALPCRSRLVRHPSGVREALGSSPGQGMAVNLRWPTLAQRLLAVVPWSRPPRHGRCLLLRLSPASRSQPTPGMPLPSPHLTNTPHQHLILHPISSPHLTLSLANPLTDPPIKPILLYESI